MDSLRAILMSLGVVLHTAEIYSVSKDWYISDPNNSIVFDFLYQVIHVFRLPAFFIIAGFFAVFSIQKYGISEFIKLRVTRIGVPLISTGIIFNSITSVFFFYYHKQYMPEFNFIITKLIPATWLNWEWVYHLWFLIFYIIYFIVGSFAYLLIVKLSQKSRSMLNTFINLIFKNGRFLLILPTFYFFFRFLGMLFPDFFYTYIFGLHKLISIFYYGIFFFWGMTLFTKKHLLEEFVNLKIWHLVVFAASLSVIAIGDSESPNIVLKISYWYAYDIVVWFLCNLTFYLFYKFLNKSSKLFLYLSEASYSIYLFHYLITAVLGFVLIDINIPSTVKFFIVIIMSFGLTLMIHHFLILKYSVLSFMFNGKTRKRVKVLKPA